MCRWLGYFGDPIRVDELVYNTAHSLIEQSRSARFTSHLTNADGFGIGWYGSEERPGVYRNVSPAWGDRNLQDLCAQIRSPLFLAHVRAATGTPVQQTNCHPFRHGRWLFVHNGFIDQYQRLRRDLMLAVDSELFERIEGTTDSELLFFLALTLGLDDEPLPALERMAGMVEAIGRRHGVEDPLQMTLGLTDGERLYAVRYASGRVRQLPLRQQRRTRCPPALSGDRAPAAPVRRGPRGRLRAARRPPGHLARRTARDRPDRSAGRRRAAAIRSARLSEPGAISPGRNHQSE